MTSTSSTPSQIDPADVIEIHAPEIDVDALMGRIRESLATRQGPERRNRVREVRLTDGLGEAFVGLQAEMGRYGEVGTARSGPMGIAELFFKRVVRKLMKRHIMQQQNVNGALLRFLDLSLAELEASRANQVRLQARIEDLEAKLGS